LYDVVLMDINLERVINGNIAAKEIRKISGYKNVPIIATTGYASSDKEQKLQEGFDGYIAKPSLKK